MMTIHDTSTLLDMNDRDQYPTMEAFEVIVQGYLRNLSCKKRDKALIDRQRYLMIVRVLKDPRDTAVSTAQFRFWVKKMFQLVPLNDGSVIVCHDNKPIAIREQIYSILVRAHREVHHGGRDKTSALVRRRYSWIPKELIARFVRHCPFCISRRHATPQTPPLMTGSATVVEQRTGASVDQPWEGSFGPSPLAEMPYPFDTLLYPTDSSPGQPPAPMACSVQPHTIVSSSPQACPMPSYPIPTEMCYSNAKLYADTLKYQHCIPLTTSLAAQATPSTLSLSFSSSTASTSVLPSPISPAVSMQVFTNANPVSHASPVHHTLTPIPSYDLDLLAQHRLF